MKKFCSLLIVTALLLASLSTSFSRLKANDSECDPGDKACLLKEATKNVQNYKEMLEEAKDDAEKYSSLIVDCEKSLMVLYEEIAELSPRIEELGKKITELEIKIEENEEKVAKLNERVLSRMIDAQGKMHFNPFLDFLLGSKGFADMIRRSYGIEAINAKEEKDRLELEDIIEQLKKDKEELAVSKAELDEKMSELEVKKVEQEQLEALYTEKKAEAEAKVEEYQNLYDNAIENRKTIIVDTDDLSKMASMSGFSSPVPGSSISAGFPYYPASFGGGTHLGIDYAAKIGTYLYAPADGVILVADDGHCSTYGYLGNSCGGYGGGVSYGGNQLYMICSVNGSVYGLTFSHLYQNSVVVDVGDVVLQGDNLARVGSSGNSTGPHCHIEMFYLGSGDNEDLLGYISRFNKGGYSLSFNCGWGSAALSNICDNNGYSAPCRLDGRDYLPG